ncbi:MAG TPA: DHH family phosphoesterase, partial [Thermoleophilia bacterium]
MHVPVVITTHQNADFDALAASVGASLLYPGAKIVFAGSLNPNVREFVSLHGETLPIVTLRAIDQTKIERLIVVDTTDPERIGDLGALFGRSGVEVVIFDHHEGENPVRPAFVRGENWVLSTDGAQASSMIHILLERGVEIGRLEATICALGIHEDTGSLTYPRTTIRDAEMLAVCMRLGASQPLIE